VPGHPASIGGRHRGGHSRNPAAAAGLCTATSWLAPCVPSWPASWRS